MYSETVTGLIAQGAKLYSTKEYEQAANVYADACASFNEEHSRDDPDLLLLYGKALFQNGVSKSGVLGGVSAVGGSEGKQEETAENNSDEDNEDDDGFQFHEGMAEGENDDANEDGETGVAFAEEEGDEEEDGDGEDEDGDEGAPEEEQTDFEAAWDILDLTRALFEKAVEEESKENAGLKTPYLASDDQEPQNKYVEFVKKLSETYDLLGEVSLETENFSQAASDLQACLELRQKLYDPNTSRLISESHYKLSLALEFCVEDPESRSKAAQHVKSAIAIFKAQAASDPTSDATKKADSEELLRDLEERYKELQKAPEQEVQAEQLDIIKGLLGEAVAGASGARVLTEAVEKKAQVNDLSSMVKKRKAKPQTDSSKKPKKD
ncbi:hypothetical protein JCM33374_g5515 [Metschnikowia sp. JCM 33374]|nr:hypothetical protein JCM33374_g5515 [Metschnikowia sp. JCM 33374]